MSGLAIFTLKYSSLLEFDQQTECEQENLESIFGVSKVCSDSQFRTILDEVNPKAIYPMVVRDVCRKNIGMGKYGIVMRC